MKARKENTLRNNIVATNLFPHKLLKMVVRLLMVVAKSVVGIILWVGYFIFSLVEAVVSGVFQFAMGCILIVASVAGFLGLILWLFTF